MSTNFPIRCARKRNLWMTAVIILFASGWSRSASPLQLPDAESVPIANGSFAEGMKGDVPTGWQAYKQTDERRRREIVTLDSGSALKLTDGDEGREIGVKQTFPVKPSLYYALTARARAVEGTIAKGVFLQLRFLPSNQIFQVPLTASVTTHATEVGVAGVAPADTTQATIYIYSSRADTPVLLVEDLSLTAAPVTMFDDITTPKSQVRQTVLARNGEAAARIVAPEGLEWQAAARKLAEALHARTGADFPVRTPSEVTEKELHQTTGILLGNVFNNRLLLHAYSHSLVFADGVYPGDGGYDLRTVHDPWGAGHNLLSIGATDAAGALEAVSSLVEKLPEGPDATLPPCHEVQLTGQAEKLWGSWFRTKLDERWHQAQEKRAIDGLANGIHCGLFSLAQAQGERYAVTRREAYAHEFVRLIRHAQRHHDTKPTTYGGPWGMDSDFRIYSIVPLWDAVEECPALSDEERLQVTRILYQWICDLDRKGRAHGDDVRFNHITFPALGCLYAGQYFAKHYGNVLQAQLWLRQAHEVFLFQARTTKAHCDCNSYQWLPIDHTSRYALATGDLTYFENGNMRTMADYIMLNRNNLGHLVANGDIGFWKGGGPNTNILRRAYWHKPDPQLAWILNAALATAPTPRLGDFARPLDDPLESPNHLLGTTAWPVPEVWYRTFAQPESPTPGVTFDKISFRDDFDPSGAYLLLDGLATGGHGHKEANCILQWAEKERIWLTDGDYIKSLPKFHNGVLVLANGQSAPMPRFSELRTLADWPDGSYANTLLSDYNGLDWERHVFHVKGRWFVVLDHLTATRTAEYSVRAVWQTIGKVKLTGTTLDVEQKDVHARIAMTPEANCLLSEDAKLGKNWRTYPYADRAVIQVLQGVRNAALEPGESLELATLLQAAGAEPSQTTIERLGPGAVRVRDEKGPALIVLPGSGARRTSLPTVGSLNIDDLEAEAIMLLPRTAMIARVRGTALPALHPPENRPVHAQIDLTTGQATILSADVYLGREKVSGTGHETGPIAGEDTVRTRIEAMPRARETSAGSESAETQQPQVKTLWTMTDTPDTFVISGNRNTFGAVNMQMQISASPDPLPANVFSGQKGANRLANLVDGTLTGTEAATMWPVDREVTLDLVFPRPVAISGLLLHAWFATSSSKGYTCQLGCVRIFAGDGEIPDDDAPLLDWRDETMHPSWGTPVPHAFDSLSCRAKHVRLVLTPRPGTGIYLAELKLFSRQVEDAARVALEGGAAFSAVDVIPGPDGDGEDEVIAGTCAGGVLLVNSRGETHWRHSLGSAALTVATLTDDKGRCDLIAATDDAGNVHALDRSGNALWTTPIPRYKGRKVARVLFPARLEKDAPSQVLVAGADNWRYHVIDRKGQLLWHYESVHPSTAGTAADLDGDGCQELLLGTAYYSWHCVNPDGSRRWQYRTRGGPGCNAVCVADVQGDTQSEVFFGGDDTLVQATTAKGEPLWRVSVGDEVTALACLDVDGDGKQEILAASLSFNVFCLSGDGSILWRRDLGAPVCAMLGVAGERPSILAGCADGLVHVIRPRDGRTLGINRGKGAVTALAGKTANFTVVARNDGTLAALAALP